MVKMHYFLILGCDQVSDSQYGNFYVHDIFDLLFSAVTCTAIRILKVNEKAIITIGQEGGGVGNTHN